MIRYIEDFSEEDQAALALLKSKRAIKGPVYYYAPNSSRRWFLSQTRKDRYVFVTLWGQPVVKGTVVDATWDGMIRDCVIVQDRKVLPYAHRN